MSGQYRLDYPLRRGGHEDRTFEDLRAVRSHLQGLGFMWWVIVDLTFTPPSAPGQSTSVDGVTLTRLDEASQRDEEIS